MAENPNIPGGPIPPKPSEAPKVQPRKETVRINLPPKPTSSATIKLPTLPTPSAPAPSFQSAAPPPPPPSAAAPPSAPKPPAPPPSVPGKPGTAVAAPPSKPGAPAPPPGKRPAPPAPAGSAAIKTADKILAIAAMVASLAALGTVLWLSFGGVYKPLGM